MKSSINAALFDRLMLVNRKMRDSEAQVITSGTHLSHREIILVILNKRGCGMKQQDIAKEIHVSKSTLSEMINRLVEDGLLDRTVAPADRRSTIVVLTERGKARAEEVPDEHGQTVDFLFRDLTDSEKEELMRLLNKLLCGGSRDNPA